ncbi:hypothetical protein RVR_8347 [Actinacidiphila reveromycinica]|uniref:Uncharacterized protein n=1 Tax=Actinacidiphila reveromycinica TaxID=659352 RepID=A0A7U3UYB9_9ACTN|nr:hypothetical protein [Streptomyces sp. SN-593]BBB01094.1 hypothetical protein RVR_8347 [Streptomyces sp. SN-593]
MSSPALTAGALAVSLAIAGANLWQWHKAGKDPKNLAHFGGGFALGGLATVCTGLLGVLAGWSVAAGNGVGKHAVSGATGNTAQALNRGTAGTLTSGGAVITFLLLIGFIIAWRAASKTVRRRLLGGFFCGATLVVTVGMAGLFVHVVNLVNGMGNPVLSWFNGGAA